MADMKQVMQAIDANGKVQTVYKKIVDLGGGLYADATAATLSGSIPEFGWVDGDAEPTPTEFSFGAKVNPATGEITTMYWDGTAWEEMR